MKILSLSILIAVLSLSEAHEFHLSKTDVHYRTEAKALQITIHTFIDDTQLALEAMDSLDYKLMEDSEHSLADSILSVYLIQNFQVTADGIPLQLSYLGKEASDDIEGLYAYLEVDGLPEPKSLEITNTLLKTQFDDQKNIIKVMRDDDDLAFHLLSGKTWTKTVDF